MENRKDADALNLLLSLLTPEVTEGISSTGAKITQNSRSLTIRIEKGSVAWDQFAEGCTLAFKQKHVKKQLLQLRGLLRREGKALRSMVRDEGLLLQKDLIKMIEKEFRA